ncbi:MAG: PUA domain-containing protein [Thermoproteota archaeon]
MLKVRRTPVRKKDVLKTIEKARIMGIEIPSFDFNQGELMEVNGNFILIVDKKPILVRDREGHVFPHILALKFVTCKTVTVDDGAVPHVLRGADIMIPGVLSYDEFDFGSVVVVKDRLGRSLGTGIAIMASKEMEARKRGKIIRILHRINDKLYEIVREL